MCKSDLNMQYGINEEPSLSLRTKTFILRCFKVRDPQVIGIFDEHVTVGKSMDGLKRTSSSNTHSFKGANCVATPGLVKDIKDLQ